MDSFSGSIPRKYISFRLGKSTPGSSSQTGASDLIEAIFGGGTSSHEERPEVTSSANEDDVNVFCSNYVASKKDPLPTVGHGLQLDNSTTKGPTSDTESQGSEKQSSVAPLDFSCSSASTGNVEEPTIVPPVSEFVTVGIAHDNVDNTQLGSPLEEPPFSETVNRILTEYVTQYIEPPTDPRLNRRRTGLPSQGATGLTGPRGTKRGPNVLESTEFDDTEGATSSSSQPRLPSESCPIEVNRDDHTYSIPYVEVTVPDQSQSGFDSNLDEGGQTSDATVEKEMASSLGLNREREAAEALNAVIGDSTGNGDSSEEDDRGATFSRSQNTLSAHSTTLIKRYFDENPSVHFPSGHHSVSFSEKQVGCLVRAVSEETSFVSFRMMTDLLEKATGAKPVFEKKSRPSDSFRTKKVPELRSSVGSLSTLGENSSDGYSSGGASTEDGLGSVVFHRQKGTTSDCDLIAATIVTPQPPKPSGSAGDPAPGDSLPSSQEHQSLADLKRQLQTQETRVPTRKSIKERNAKRRQIPDDEKPYRPNRILSNASFDGFEWAKVFATGPRDPNSHKYSFYCRFCDKDVSMYGKGRGELIRHYQRKSHFRVDQRWRYEHLRKVNPLTGVTRYFVRGWDGRVLDFSDLQKELPHFEDTPLVEIGPCYPYYNDYVKGIQVSSNSSTTKASVQISVFASFLPGNGNLSFLSRFWSDLGLITNHHSNFADFDWSQQNILVSCFNMVLFWSLGPQVA